MIASDKTPIPQGIGKTPLVHFTYLKSVHPLKFSCSFVGLSPTLEWKRGDDRDGKRRLESRLAA